MSDWILIPANRVNALKALKMKDNRKRKSTGSHNAGWRIVPTARKDSPDFVVSARVLSHPRYNGAKNLLKNLTVETWTEAEELARLDIDRGLDP